MIFSIPDGATVLFFANLASAAATVAVGFFGGVQLYREKQRQSQAEKAARTRLSATGYLLRRELRRWLASDQEGRDFEDWLRDAQNSHTLVTQVDQAIRYAREMMADLGDAPRDVQGQVGQMYVHLLEGTRRLHEFVSMGAPDHTDVFDFVDMRTAAENDLRACGSLLENEIIEPQLLRIERELAAQRKGETFVQTMMEALRQEGVLESETPPTAIVSPSLLSRVFGRWRKPR